MDNRNSNLTQFSTSLSPDPSPHELTLRNLSMLTHSFIYCDYVSVLMEENSCLLYVCQFCQTSIDFLSKTLDVLHEQQHLMSSHPSLAQKLVEQWPTTCTRLFQHHMQLEDLQGSLRAVIAMFNKLGHEESTEDCLRPFLTQVCQRGSISILSDPSNWVSNTPEVQSAPFSS